MEKIYVGHTNKITLTCPKCGLVTNKIVSKFKNTHKKLKAKCQCGEVFRFTLDFRKYYRKNVQLTGEYFVQGKDENGEIRIEDISKTGIKFTTLKPNNFYKYDLVELKFALDDSMKMNVRTRIKIMWTNGHTAGAKFSDPKILEKDLGLFLIK